MMEDAFHGWIVMVSGGVSSAHPGVGNKGGRVVPDVSVNDMQARMFLSHCSDESCGKFTRDGPHRARGGVNME